jgi:hypothetical protein
MLKGGLTLNPSLTLGAETNGWRHDEEGVERWHGTLNLLLNWYPRYAGGLHLKGGLGLTYYRASDAEDAFTSTAFGPQLGVGYDLPVGSRLSVTPQFDITTAGFGDLKFNGEPVTNSAVYQFIRIGIGLTWH